MNKAEFLYVLERELSDISPEERQEAIIYYRQYFEDAGEENEKDILQELKSPIAVAREIKANCAQTQNYYSQNNATYSNAKPNTPPYQNRQYNNNGYQNQGNYQNYQGSYSPPKKSKGCGVPTVVIIILLVFTFPFWAGLFGIIMGLFGAVMGAFFGLFGSVMGAIGGLIGTVIASIVAIFSGAGLSVAIGGPIGMLILGVGLVALSVAILVISLLIWAIKKIVIMVRDLFKNR